MSVNVCEQNQLRSEWDPTRVVWYEWAKQHGGDFRCKGCNGLHDQPQENEKALSSSLKWALEEILTVDFSSESEEHVELETQELDDLSMLEGLGLDLTPEQLEALFPGLSSEIKHISEDDGDDIDDEEPPRPRWKPREKPQRVAVYQGRCSRCGGYMVNAKEQHFDDTYRCVSCGRWVSPVYLWNRDNPGLAGAE
jgi:hypothetical protein